MTSKDTVESARRFLWDEDGDSGNSRPSTTPAAGRFTGGRGGDYVDQSVNLMAMGDTSPASGVRGGIMGGGGGGDAGSDAELGGAGVMHRVSGLFRTGSSRQTQATTSASTDARLDEYGDASPSTEAEEYLDNGKHRRRITPILATLLGSWNACLDSCAVTCGRLGLPKLLFFASVLMVGLAFVGWYFAGGSSTGGGGGGGDDSREALVMERIINAGISTQLALTVAQTPQQLALQWIVTDDAAQLPTTHDDLLERYVLAVFYYSTNGKSGGWTNDKNWLSKKGICSWYGVRCVPIENPTAQADQPMIESYDDNAAVIKLELAENKMEGTLPAELTGLSSLASLDLSSNELSGGIPTALGKMFAIKNVNLRSNKMVGPIPSELGQLSSTLHTLQVGMNQLTGTLPSELGYIGGLRAFGATGNLLNGKVPDAWSTLTKMSIFYIDENQISGTIPDFLNEWTDLTDFRLRANKMTGNIPQEEFFPLKNLEILHLDTNSFTGPIPDFWEHTRRVSEVRLENNKLTSTIPATLGELIGLKILQLNANKLTGPIPYNLGYLADVHTITLNNNALTGTIPTMLGNLDDIVVLRLNSNKLVGKIPSEIGTCFRLKELRVDNNQISGPIPKELSELKELETLTMYENSFIDAEMPIGVCTLVRTGRLTMLSADCPNGVTCDCCHECGA